MNITTEQLREVYTIAAFAKELDDKVQQLLMAGTIRTTWFSWRGSELLGAVIGKSMRPEDYMVAYYRDGMSQMAKGFPAKNGNSPTTANIRTSQNSTPTYTHQPPARNRTRASQT